MAVEEINRLNKKEDTEYMFDPTQLKVGDAPLQALLARQKAPDKLKKLGIGNTEMLDACPIFNRAEAEYEITYRNLNCGIILGRDRPADRLSGYGAIAAKRSAAIDIVAGRMGPEAATTNKQGEELYCENNYMMDSCRIVLSQRTNIDQNFKIRCVVNKPSKNTAGIGIKADSVRIIGRKDVRIVTGTDFYDARGQTPGVDYQIPCKISLIGDNRDDLLQPMVKGYNLLALIGEIASSLHAIVSTIDTLIMNQNIINLAVINHTHRETINPAKFGFPAEDLMFKGYQPAINLVSQAKSSLTEITGMIEAAKIQYILAPSDGLANNRNILSNFNFCN